MCEKIISSFGGYKSCPCKLMAFPYQVTVLLPKLE